MYVYIYVNIFVHSTTTFPFGSKSRMSKRRSNLQYYFGSWLKNAGCGASEGCKEKGKKKKKKKKKWQQGEEVIVFKIQKLTSRKRSKKISLTKRRDDGRPGRARGPLAADAFCRLSNIITP